MNNVPLNEQMVGQSKRKKRLLTWTTLIPSWKSVVLILFFIGSLLLNGNFNPLTKRGFFCNDSSINYPKKRDTIGLKTLMLVSLVIPSLVIKFCDMHTIRIMSTISFSKWRLIRKFYRGTFSESQLFFFGFSSTMLLTGIGKITVGRMRPHFMQMCRPNVDCSTSDNWYKYIENFNCTNKDLTQRDYSYITTSWPSGHAAIVFYSMLYLIIYLQTTIQILAELSVEGMKKRLEPQMLFAIFLLMIGLAGYISGTRISDYHHHPLDVLSGSILGSLTAFAFSRYLLSKQYLLIMNSTHGD